MGTVKNFEDLEVWKISRELINLIYSDFRNCKDFTFKDQITRAGISSMNNISERFYRNSDSEFRHFLNISKGSEGEIKNMYYIAEDQKYILPGIADDRRKLAQRLLNANSSLMRSLRSSS